MTVRPGFLLAACALVCLVMAMALHHRPGPVIATTAGTQPAVQHGAGEVAQAAPFPGRLVPPPTEGSGEADLFEQQQSESRQRDLYRLGDVDFNAADAET